MASMIDLTGLTINEDEAREIGALIIEKALVQGTLSEVHEIMTGIHHKQQIPFAGRIADSLKASSGCVPNAGTGVTLTEKFWEPEKYDARWTHCAADLNALQKLFAKAQRVNPDFYDRIDSQELGVLYAMIETMLIEVLPEKVWFSDKNAADTDNSGVFTVGTDLGLYNVINGIFVEIFADSQIPRVTISENSQASYFAQRLPEDGAYDYLTEMVNKADARLIEDPSAFILVTRSMADNYRSTLRNKNLGAGFLEVVENGRPQLRFDGIPLIVKHEWDRFISANQNDGSKWNLPHRAVMTVRENIPVGTIAQEDMETLDSFYDRTLKSNIVDVALSLDAKHLESYMTVVAY